MRLRRSATRLIPIVGLMLGVAAPREIANAQIGWLRRDSMDFEIRPLAGAFLPAGHGEKRLPSAALAGLQMSLAASRHFALAVTVVVAPTTDPSTVGTPGVDIVMYDLGAEWRLGGWRPAGRALLTPFIGAGLGSLAYEYRDSLSNSISNRDGYVALGGDIGLGRVGIRLEGRDYRSRVRALPIPGSGQTTRNELTVSLGLAFRLGRSASPELMPPPAALVSSR